MITSMFCKIYIVYDSDKQLCRVKLAELKESLETGIFLSDVPFCDYAENWINKSESILAKSTLRGYRSILNIHIKGSHLASLKISDINHSHIQGFLADCCSNSKKGSLSEKTQNNILGFLKSVFSTAYADKIIKYNPAIGKFRIIRSDPYQYYIYSVEEMQQLLAALGQSRDAIPVALAALCGLRISEVCGLKWEDVNFEKNTISINRACVGLGSKTDIKVPKSKTSMRTVYMPDYVRNLLFINKRDHGFVLGDGFIPENPTNYSRRFSRFLKNNGLPHTRFHDLRHFNATTMLKAGLPEKQISKQLGHSDTNITKRYEHILESMESRPAEIFNQICSQNGSHTKKKA